MINRRAYQRVAEENRVAVTVLSSPSAPDLEGKTFFCPTEDVSAGGLRLSLYRALPRGTVLEMKVAFHKPLKAFRHRGQVVWIRELPGKHPYAVGIEFASDTASSAEWTAFMNAKTPTHNPPPPA